LSFWISSFEKLFRNMSNYILGYFIAERLELTGKIAILMLYVRNSIGKVLLVIEKLFDISFLLMRLNKILSIYAICEAIWSKGN
jgi:hypothetical protein